MTNKAVVALQEVLEMVDKDIIRVRPSDRDVFLAALQRWNEALDAEFDKNKQGEGKTVNTNKPQADEQTWRPSDERDGMATPDESDLYGGETDMQDYPKPQG